MACHADCLRSASFPPSGAKPSLSPPVLTGIPPSYHDLAPVFSKESTLSLPPHRPYDCAIDLLPGGPLPVGWLYNLSIPEKEAMRNYITESLASGIIRPSSFPVAAGFFFVAKKDGSLRPCIHYCQLNTITVKNKYPIPLLSSTFEPLTHTTIFTKLDLRNAYHLVRIREGDEWKTGFNTHLGHFEYLVMPFGLTNAPAVFQTLVNDVLRDFINVFVVVYLDDILIFSRTPKEHTTYIRLVLQRLLENRFFIKAEKFVFNTASVEFLGHILEKGQVRADPKKVRAAEEWAASYHTQLRRFLGFANFYRRFIRGFSQVAACRNSRPRLKQRPIRPLLLVSPRTSSLTVVPSSSRACGGPSVRALGPSASLLGHPQTNARSLTRVATLRWRGPNPASWSLHLPQEYLINIMVSLATGLSPFLCSLGYQPDRRRRLVPLFGHTFGAGLEGPLRHDSPRTGSRVAKTPTNQCNWFMTAYKGLHYASVKPLGKALLQGWHHRVPSTQLICISVVDWLNSRNLYCSSYRMFSRVRGDRQESCAQTNAHNSKS